MLCWDQQCCGIASCKSVFLWQVGGLVWENCAGDPGRPNYTTCHQPCPCHADIITALLSAIQQYRPGKYKSDSYRLYICSCVRSFVCSSVCLSSFIFIHFLLLKLLSIIMSCMVWVVIHIRNTKGDKLYFSVLLDSCYKNPSKRFKTSYKEEVPIAAVGM